MTKPSCCLRMYCDQCGKEISSDTLFCGNCGKSLREASSSITSADVSTSAFVDPRTTKYCVNCGSMIDKNAEICPKCGVRVKSPDVVDNLYEKLMQKPNTAYHGFQGGAMKYCQKCGSPNNITTSYCLNCGEVSFGTKPPTKISRPTGVTVLAVFAILVAVLNFFIGLAVAAIFALFLPGLAALIFLFAIGLIIWSLVVNISLLTGRKWARILVLVGAVFSLLEFPVGTIFGIVLIWYFTKASKRCILQAAQVRRSNVCIQSFFLGMITFLGCLKL